MKKGKKLLAITLSLALVLALVVLPSSAVVTTEKSTTVLFEDDFNGYGSATTLKELKSQLTANGYVTGGTMFNNTHATESYSDAEALTVPQGTEMYLSTGSVPGSEDWSEYSVSADVKFNAAPVVPEGDADGAVNSYALLVINAPSVSAGGYEFGFQYSVKHNKETNEVTETKNIIIRRRGGTFDEVSYVSKNIFIESFDLVVGETYSLKLVYQAGMLYGYVNGKLGAVVDTTNTPEVPDELRWIKGVAGVRLNGAYVSVSYDNFKVEKEEKVVWFKEDFDYSNVANPVEEIEKAGWTDAEGFYGALDNGKIVFDSDTSVSYIASNARGVEAWDDYTAEADVTLDANNITSGSIFVGLLGRANGTYGYECGITLSSSNNVALRLRSIAKANKSLASVTLDKFTGVPTTYHVSMEMYGSVMVCSVEYNGKTKTFTYDTSVEGYEGAVYTKGAIGIKTIAPTEGKVSASISNLKITSYEPTTEYFNKSFANTNVAELKAEGFTVADGIVDENLAKGALTPATTFANTLLYSSEITAKSYSVETQYVMNSTSEAITHGIIIGLPNAETKSTSSKTAYIPEVRVKASGETFAVRIRKVGTSGALSNVTVSSNSSITADNAAVNLSSNIAMGEPVRFVVNVSYNEETDISRLTASVYSGDTFCGSTHMDVSGDLSGYAALRKNATTNSMSYNYFKASPTTYYESPVIGELDGDKVVTNLDGKYIHNALLAKAAAENADLNQDGKFNICDLVYFENVYKFYVEDTKDLIMQNNFQNTKWDGTLKFLAIGNSFSQDSMQYLYNIAKAEGVAEENIKIAIVYKGNTTLKDHYNNASKNNAVYTYKEYDPSINNWKETDGTTIYDGIKAEDWNIISLQQNSTYAGSPSYFDTTLDYMVDYVNKNKTNPDCQLAYNVTWAYPGDSTHEGFAYYNNDQLTMYNAICNAAIERIYGSFKFDMVFPTGTTIQNMRSSFLGDTLNRDEHHLNLYIGRYVAAYTLYRTITGQPLTDLKYAPSNIILDERYVPAVIEAVNAAIANPVNITPSSYTE